MKRLPLRLEWQHTKKNDDDMDVDCAEGRMKRQTAGEGGPLARPICEEEGGLDTLKATELTAGFWAVAS